MTRGWGVVVGQDYDDPANPSLPSGGGGGTPPTGTPPPPPPPPGGGTGGETAVTYSTTAVEHLTPIDFYDESSPAGGAALEKPGGTLNFYDVRGILKLVGLPPTATAVRVQYTLRGSNGIADPPPEDWPDGSQRYKWEWRLTSFAGVASADFAPGGQVTLQTGDVVAASMNRADSRNDLGSFEFTMSLVGGPNLYLMLVNVSDEGGYTTTAPNATHVEAFPSDGTPLLRDQRSIIEWVGLPVVTAL